MTSGKRFAFTDIHGFLSGLFDEDVHAKRVYSLANATLGVMTAASLAVAAIGHGLALARGGLTKHAIKQVDRLLSNPGIDIDLLLARWVPFMVGSRPSIAVAMDWTDLGLEAHSLLPNSLVSQESPHFQIGPKRSANTGCSSRSVA